MATAPQKPQKPHGSDVPRAWPFPVFPNPKDTRNGVRPKFNPNNHEEAPL